MTAAPVSAYPVVNESTGGAPISLQPLTNSTALSGVTSDVLSSTAAPAANAGMPSMAALANGKFHGMINPTTG